MNDKIHPVQLLIIFLLVIVILATVFNGFKAWESSRDIKVIKSSLQDIQFIESVTYGE